MSRISIVVFLWTLTRSCLLFIALSPAAATAQPLQLSPTYPQGSGVWSTVWSADSQWVYYLATDGVVDCGSVYRVHRSGGDSVRLSGPPPPTCSLDIIGLTANGDRVILLRQLSSSWELVTARTDGSGDDSTVLASIPDSVGEIYDVSLSGQQLIYQVLLDSLPNFSELYWVPAQGPASATTRLDSAGTDYWRPLDQHSGIIYTDGPHLYSQMAAAPSAPTRLDSSLPGAAPVGGFKVEDSQDRVLYRAAQEQVVNQNLFMVPTVGPASASRKMNGELLADHSICFWDFVPSGSHIVFSTCGPSFERALFSARTDAQTPDNVRLDQAAAVKVVRYAPGGDAVFFLSNRENTLRNDLYRVPIEGPASAARRLNNDAVAVTDFAIADNGSTIVMRTDGGEWQQDPSAIDELYRVSAVDEAAVPALLSGLAPDQRIEVTGGMGTQIGDRWVYTGQINPGTAKPGPPQELFSVALTGPRNRTARRLNTNLEQAQVTSYQSADEGRWTVFTDQPIVGQFRTFMVPTHGNTDALPVFPLLPAWFDSRSPRIMSDDTTILFTIRADEISPTGRTLYRNVIPPIFSDGFETGSVNAWN